MALLKSSPDLHKLCLQTCRRNNPPSLESTSADTYRPSELVQKMTAVVVAANQLSKEGGISPDTANYYKPRWMFPIRDETDLPTFSQLLKQESNANSANQSRLDPIQVQKVNYFAIKRHFCSYSCIAPEPAVNDVLFKTYCDEQLENIFSLTKGA